jgi:hypothetical protein
MSSRKHDTVKQVFCSMYGFLTQPEYYLVSVSHIHIHASICYVWTEHVSYIAPFGNNCTRRGAPVPPPLQLEPEIEIKANSWRAGENGRTERRKEGRVGGYAGLVSM